MNLSNTLITAASDDKIVGGTVAAPHAAPFIANIRRSGSLMCGGSLVAPGYVISAAHCEYRYRTELYNISESALRTLNITSYEYEATWFIISLKVCKTLRVSCKSYAINHFY